VADGEVRVLATADLAVQETLVTENEPDPMDREQTWPTSEEIQQAKADKQQVTRKVPKGTSAYQAAWIVDDDDDEPGDDSDDDDSDDKQSLFEPMENEDSDEEGGTEGGDQEEYETVTVTEAGDPVKYDERMDLDEERQMLQKIQDARQDALFPDEVDTPTDVDARVRFQKYRGLQSFRTSPWDPKENLPEDYSKIFQFANFRGTKKRILEADEEETGAMPGMYVTLHVLNVPKFMWESRSPSSPLVVYGMLPYEQKMSVTNMVLHPQPSCTQPIKSKERLLFHVGYRRFSACPIFSQHTRGNKHKYERFLPSEGAAVASVYSPIMFPPGSVLVFKEKPDGSQQLVATGAILSVEPDRVVTKRVVLSGHPFKIFKRSAVIRYMFFNRSDIEWFKPIELRTKYGRRGHIKEPLGTHGHMKCVFNMQLRSNDTIMLNLFKRVFPKWTYDPQVPVPPALFTPATTTSVTDDVTMD